jgi:hypothetical protein
MGFLVGGFSEYMSTQSGCFLELLKAIIKDSVLNSRGRFGIRIIPGRKTNA